MAGKARGGLSKVRVHFKGQTDTLEKVFGSSPIQVTDMTKKLWSVIKSKKLMKRIG